MNKIIIEVTASRDCVKNETTAQRLDYLKVSDCKFGLIINFGKSSLEYKRLKLKPTEG